MTCGRNLSGRSILIGLLTVFVKQARNQGPCEQCQRDGCGHGDVDRSEERRFYTELYSRWGPNFGDGVSEMGASKRWFARHAEAEAGKDRLSLSDRAGNVVGILAMLVLLWFFIAHQTSSTGFFTSKFGQTEAFLFYAPPLLSIIATAAKAAVGRKNVLRPLDVAGMILSFVALVWVFAVFPFDFSHLADVLPGFLRFLLQWISNDLARGVMALAMILIPIAAVYTAALYVFVRRELKS